MNQIAFIHEVSAKQGKSEQNRKFIFSQVCISKRNQIAFIHEVMKKRAKSQIYFFASVYIKKEPSMNTITSIEEEPDVVSPFNKTAIIIIKITINNKYT